MTSITKLGLIAGNGKFPFLVLDAAKAQGFDVIVAAIKEETFPEIESRGAAAVHPPNPCWLEHSPRCGKLIVGCRLGSEAMLSLLLDFC